MAQSKPRTLLWETRGKFGPEFVSGVSRSARLNEILRKVGANFPLAEGVQILGKVIGRLTGHLDASGQGEK